MSIELVNTIEVEDGAEVVQVVTYNFIHDFDFVPYGEGEVERDTSFVEILDVQYRLAGAEYSPTDYEKKYWESDLEDECAKHYGEIA